MSQIATFKRVELAQLNKIKEAIAQNTEEARRICEEIDGDDDLDLENGNCSGDVFSALFDYLEAEHDLDFMEDSEYLDVLNFWQEVTEPLDLIIFTLDVAGDILAVLEDDNFGEEDFIEYMDVDWEIEADDALDGMVALRDNLQRVNSKQALLYFLY